MAPEVDARAQQQGNDQRSGKKVLTQRVLLLDLQKEPVRLYKVVNSGEWEDILRGEYSGASGVEIGPINISETSFHTGPAAR